MFKSLAIILKSDALSELFGFFLHCLSCKIVNLSLIALVQALMVDSHYSLQEKLEKNSNNIQSYVSHLKDLAESRDDSTTTTTTSSGNLLSLRMNSPLCKVSGLVQECEDRDGDNSEEVVFSRTAKLPLVERIPSYTTWIFLDRYQIYHHYFLFLNAYSEISYFCSVSLLLR